METIKVEARLRTRYTKGDIKAARRQGRVPGAVFGKGIEPFLVEVSTRSIVDILRSEGALNTLLELNVTGAGKKTVIISELDRDPVTRGFLHVGFHNVAKGDKVHTQLPIRLIGTPIVVTQRLGMVDQTLETLDVRAESGDLPSHIDVDISKLEVGDKLHVSDLPHSTKIEYLTHDEITIVGILPVLQVEETEPDAAASPTAPEESEPAKE
jgi:large subunit ribosomal protein L25